jgi:hypothetical protein
MVTVDLKTYVVTANVVPSSPIFVTLMMEAIQSSEKSVLIRTTGRHSPKDRILLGFVVYETLSVKQNLQYNNDFVLVQAKFLFRSELFGFPLS